MKLIEFIKSKPYLYKFALRVKKIRDKCVIKQIYGHVNIVTNMALTSRIKYNITGDNNHLKFDKNSKISNINIFIHGSGNKVYIGENVIFKSGSIWFEGENCTLEIGKNTTIECAHFLIVGDTKSITLGDDCLLSTGIVFRTSDSHSIIEETSNCRINPDQSIVVDRHVWIGADVKILKGVEIKKNSIIGNGSIVTKNVPQGAIAVGSPASVKKTGINWLRERI